jgi:hypothetical protein
LAAPAPFLVTVPAMHVSIQEYVERQDTMKPPTSSTAKVIKAVLFACGLIGFLAAFAFFPAVVVIGPLVLFLIFAFFELGFRTIRFDPCDALREIYRQNPHGLFLKVAAGAPGTKRTSWPRDAHLLSVSSGRFELVGPAGSISAPLETVQLRYNKRTGRRPFIEVTKYIEVHHPGGIVMIDPDLNGADDLEQIIPVRVERMALVLDELIADQRARSAANGMTNGHLASSAPLPPPASPASTLPPPAAPLPPPHGTTPAGWYPDAASPTGRRWWDGQGWTSHT